MSFTIKAVEEVYKGWVTIKKAIVSDGTSTFPREIEDHGSAVAILPYDPDRRMALLVKLPRAPVLLAGGADHLLEAPAGLIDAGETPEVAAKREANEEVGVVLPALEPIGQIWSMPGISTERMTMFLAPYTSAARTGAGGGLADENENITVVEMPLAELAALADRNELLDMKTLCLIQTLRLRHPALF